MLWNILSSRGIIMGLVFFVLIVSGSLLYSWHVRRTTEAELAQTHQSLQQLKKKNEVPAEIATHTVDIDTPGFVNTPEENTNTPTSDEIEALPNETNVVDLTDTFLPDDMISETATEEDVRVSPFGFGPYPEIPVDYFGEPIWTQDTDLPNHVQREVELIDRVLVKLWQQGDKSIVGGSTYKGKIYPHYKDTAYIRWSESVSSDGTIHRYISRIKGALDGPTDEEIESGDIPPGFKIIELDDAGYDPYTFLDLQ